jgi:hypothetical protein
MQAPLRGLYRVRVLLAKKLIPQGTRGSNMIWLTAEIRSEEPGVAGAEMRKSIHSEAKKTYNRRDSQMVTHSSTSRPVQCLCMAERTGCPVLTDLWSYVIHCAGVVFMIVTCIFDFWFHWSWRQWPLFRNIHNVSEIAEDDPRSGRLLIDTFC